MIKQVDINEIQHSKRAPGKLVKEVLDFYQSGWSAAEVDISGYSSVRSANTAYRQAIRAAKIDVVLCERKGRLYLMRGEL